MYPLTFSTTEWNDFVLISERGCSTGSNSRGHSILTFTGGKLAAACLEF